jgi:hypothetical protein
MMIEGMIRRTKNLDSLEFQTPEILPMLLTCVSSEADKDVSDLDKG